VNETYSESQELIEPAKVEERAGPPPPLPAGLRAEDKYLRLVNAIAYNSTLLANYVHKYFVDMLGHLESLKDTLQSRAAVHYIVGNSKFYDVLLPVEEIFASMFRELGFGDVSVRPIRKRTSKKELFEFIVSAKAG
jgi:hypothetical protein